MNIAARLSADEAARTPEETLRALLTAGSTKKPAKAVKTESVRLGSRTLYKIAPRGNGIQIKFGAKLAPEIAQQAQEKVKQVLTDFLAKVEGQAKP
jgi:hypothetical protein